MVPVEGGLFVVLTFNGLLLVGFGGVNLIFNGVGINVLEGQILPGTCFVQQVNRLVRQVAVLDVAVGQFNGCHQGVVSVLDMVVILVATLDPFQNLNRFFHAWFCDFHWLEPPGQGAVLFNLAVFV